MVLTDLSRFLAIMYGILNILSDEVVRKYAALSVLQTQECTSRLEHELTTFVVSYSAEHGGENRRMGNEGCKV